MNPNASEGVRRAYARLGACRRFVFALIVAIIAVSLFLATNAPVSFAAGPIVGKITIDGVDYGYSAESGEATITSISKAEENLSETYEAVIPAYIELPEEAGGRTCLVTAIGDNVMGTKVTGATLANFTAEKNSELTKIVVPAKVLSIGNEAFAGCDMLTELIVCADDDGASHLESIGEFAFFQSSISAIELPDSVTSVKYLAFAECENVASIRFPASRLTIDSSALYGTSNAASVIIPQGCTSLPQLELSKVDSVSIPPSVQSDVSLSMGQASAETLVDLPAEVDFSTLDLNVGAATVRSGGISWRIPEGIQSLSLIGLFERVELPSTLLTLSAVQSVNLTSIVVPRSVVEIGPYCFSRCSKLSSVEFEEGSALARLSRECFSNCASLSSIKLPNGLAHVNAGAFSGCSSLVSVELPASVRNVTQAPFKSCANLERVAFSPGKGMGDCVVWGLAVDCPKLADVVLPNGRELRLTRVESGSFPFIENCSALARVFTFDPDCDLQSSDFVECGCFEVFGWGTPGTVIDFAEDAALVFTPYAELDEAWFNGAANVSVALDPQTHRPLVMCSFTNPVNYDYERILVEESDYTVREVEDGAAWLLTGNNVTCFGSRLAAANRPLTSATMDSIGAQVLTGSSACCPKVTVRYGGEVLVQGRDYELSYDRNDRAGKARAIATAVPGSGYVGEISGEFSISERHELAAVPALSRADAALAAVTGVGAAAPASCQAVVVAWAFDSADVALGSALAAAEGAQLLCVSNACGLTAAQLACLSSWGATRAYVVGGAARCGQGTVDALVKAGVACTPVGQGAATDAALSVAVAGASRAWGDVAVACNPAEPAVCAAAAAYAAAVDAPVVFTLPDGTFDAAGLAVLTSRGRVVVVGDMLAVDSSLESAFAALPGAAPQVVRIGALGDDPVALSRSLAAYARQTGAYAGEDVTFSTAPENASANTASALAAGRVKGEFLVK